MPMIAGGRVALLGQLDRAADAVVVDVVAGLEQRLALLEGRALLAVAGDTGQLRADGLAGVALGGERRERGRDDRVVGLRRVAVVLQRRVDRQQALAELRGRLGAGQRALGARRARRRGRSSPSALPRLPSTR